MTNQNSKSSELMAVTMVVLASDSEPDQVLQRRHQYSRSTRSVRCIRIRCSLITKRHRRHRLRGHRGGRFNVPFSVSLSVRCVFFRRKSSRPTPPMSPYLFLCLQLPPMPRYLGIHRVRGGPLHPLSTLWTQHGTPPLRRYSISLLKRTFLVFSSSITLSVASPLRSCSLRAPSSTNRSTDCPNEVAIRG